MVVPKFFAVMMVAMVLSLSGRHVVTADTQAGDAIPRPEYNQMRQSTNDENPATSSEQLGKLRLQMVKGPAKTPITIIEYADFQCPFCVKVVSTLETLLEHYPDQVRLKYGSNLLLCKL